MERARTEHHICGLLTGTLPLIPQQNVFLGLPLRLLAEEVVYLLRKGVAVLIDETRAYMSPTADERETFLEQEKQQIQAQKERTLQQQDEQRRFIESKLQTEEVGALERRRARQAAKKSPIPNEVLSNDASKRTPYVHYTLGESVSIPGYVPCTQAMLSDMPAGAQVNAYMTLKEAMQAGVWTYPLTLEQRARCAVYEDLHEQGYFLSTGLRFGGDFVVYPGDPLRYHSHFTATILATPEQAVPAFHIIASGRLGTAVKKSHLLCQANTFIRDDTQAEDRRRRGDDDTLEKPWGQVQYWSLAWAGFGT